MKQSRASRSSSPSCIWGTGKPTGAVAMITANTNNLYGHQLDNIRKWREQFVQLPQFVLKHKLTVLWTKPPDFRRVFVYFWHHVDRLGKLPSKEQQLSRTQHFILKAHAAIFVLHIQYGPRGTPLARMVQRQNCLLSTHVKLLGLAEQNHGYLTSLHRIRSDKISDKERRVRKFPTFEMTVFLRKRNEMHFPQTSKSKRPK